MRFLSELALMTAFAGYVVLMMVGVRSWRRTAGLRAARPLAGPELGTSVVTTTHLVTLVPGWCGVALFGGGISGAASSLLPLALGSALVGAGLFVAVSGFARRVVAIEVRPQRVEVRYRSGRPFDASWAAIQDLRSPRWPLGGWTIVAGERRCTLMPSDLWGKEAVLAQVADATGYLTTN